MSTSLTSIGCSELREKMERGDAFVLVDALSLISFAASHLPGAVHIPPEQVEERAPARIPDLETEIVVYCSSPNCEASIEVGQRLLGLGYTNVVHYAGGKREWIDAGFPLEGGRV